MSSSATNVSGGNKTSDKKKFNAINLNYKGKTTTETQKTVARSHGLQSLGKVSTRRMPPPVQIPSLKSENLGNDPTINLVGGSGSGWAASKTQSSSSQRSSGQQSSQPNTSEKPASDAKPNQTTNTGGNNVSSSAAAGKSWSAMAKPVAPSAPPSTNPQSHRFHRDFPSLEGAGNQSGRENGGSSSTGVELRPQNMSSWKEPRSANTARSSSEKERGAGGINTVESADRRKYGDTSESTSATNQQNKSSILDVETDWAAVTGEIDYSKKIDFGDNDDTLAEDVSRGGSGNLSENRTGRDDSKSTIRADNTSRSENAEVWERGVGERTNRNQIPPRLQTAPTRYGPRGGDHDNWGPPPREGPNNWTRRSHDDGIDQEELEWQRRQKYTQSNINNALDNAKIKRANQQRTNSSSSTGEHKSFSESDNPTTGGFGPPPSPHDPRVNPNFPPSFGPSGPHMYPGSYGPPFRGPHPGQIAPFYGPRHPFPMGPQGNFHGMRMMGQNQLQPNQDNSAVTFDTKDFGDIALYFKMMENGQQVPEDLHRKVKSLMGRMGNPDMQKHLTIQKHTSAPSKSDQPKIQIDPFDNKENDNETDKTRNRKPTTPSSPVDRKPVMASSNDKKTVPVEKDEVKKTETNKKQSKEELLDHTDADLTDPQRPVSHESLSHIKHSGVSGAPAPISKDVIQRDAQTDRKNNMVKLTKYKPSSRHSSEKSERRSEPKYTSVETNTTKKSQPSNNTETKISDDKQTSNNQPKSAWKTPTPPANPKHDESLPSLSDAANKSFQAHTNQSDGSKGQAPPIQQLGQSERSKDSPSSDDSKPPNIKRARESDYDDKGQYGERYSTRGHGAREYRRSGVTSRGYPVRRGARGRASYGRTYDRGYDGRYYDPQYERKYDRQDNYRDVRRDKRTEKKNSEEKEEGKSKIEVEKREGPIEETSKKLISATDEKHDSTSDRSSLDKKSSITQSTDTKTEKPALLPTPDVPPAPLPDVPAAPLPQENVWDKRIAEKAARETPSPSQQPSTTNKTTTDKSYNKEKTADKHESDKSERDRHTREKGAVFAIRRGSRGSQRGSRSQNYYYDDSYYYYERPHRGSSRGGRGSRTNRSDRNERYNKNKTDRHNEHTQSADNDGTDDMKIGVWAGVSAEKQTSATANNNNTTNKTNERKDLKTQSDDTGVEVIDVKRNSDKRRRSDREVKIYQPPNASSGRGGRVTPSRGSRVIRGSRGGTRVNPAVRRGVNRTSSNNSQTADGGEPEATTADTTGGKKRNDSLADHEAGEESWETASESSEHLKGQAHSNRSSVEKQTERSTVRGNSHTADRRGRGSARGRGARGRGDRGVRNARPNRNYDVYRVDSFEFNETPVIQYDKNSELSDVSLPLTQPKLQSTTNKKNDKIEKKPREVSVDLSNYAGVAVVEGFADEANDSDEGFEVVSRTRKRKEEIKKPEEPESQIQNKPKHQYHSNHSQKPLRERNTGENVSISNTRSPARTSRSSNLPPRLQNKRRQDGSSVISQNITSDLPVSKPSSDKPAPPSIPTTEFEITSWEPVSTSQNSGSKASSSHITETSSSIWSASETSNSNVLPQTAPPQVVVSTAGLLSLTADKKPDNIDSGIDEVMQIESHTTLTEKISERDTTAVSQVKTQPQVNNNTSSDTLTFPDFGLSANFSANSIWSNNQETVEQNTKPPNVPDIVFGNFKSTDVNVFSSHENYAGADNSRSPSSLFHQSPTGKEEQQTSLDSNNSAASDTLVSPRSAVVSTSPTVSQSQHAAGQFQNTQINAQIRETNIKTQMNTKISSNMNSNQHVEKSVNNTNTERVTSQLDSSATAFTPRGDFTTLKQSQQPQQQNTTNTTNTVQTTLPTYQQPSILNHSSIDTTGVGVWKALSTNDFTPPTVPPNIASVAGPGVMTSSSLQRPLSSLYPQPTAQQIINKPNNPGQPFVDSNNQTALFNPSLRQSQPVSVGSSFYNSAVTVPSFIGYNTAQQTQLNNQVNSPQTPSTGFPTAPLLQGFPGAQWTLQPQNQSNAAAVQQTKPIIPHQPQLAQPAGFISVPPPNQTSSPFPPATFPPQFLTAHQQANNEFKQWTNNSMIETTNQSLPTHQLPNQTTVSQVTVNQTPNKVQTFTQPPPQFTPRPQLHQIRATPTAPLLTNQRAVNPQQIAQKFQVHPGAVTTIPGTGGAGHPTATHPSANRFGQTPGPIQRPPRLPAHTKPLPQPAVISTNTGGATSNTAAATNPNTAVNNRYTSRDQQKAMQKKQLAEYREFLKKDKPKQSISPSAQTGPNVSAETPPTDAVISETSVIQEPSANNID